MSVFFGGVRVDNVRDPLEKAWRRVNDKAIDAWARGVAAAFVVAAASKVDTPLWTGRAATASELAAVVAQAPVEFVARFARGYGAYVRGQWPVAVEQFAQLVESIDFEFEWRLRAWCAAAAAVPKMEAGDERRAAHQRIKQFGDAAAEQCIDKNQRAGVATLRGRLLHVVEREFADAETLLRKACKWRPDDVGARRFLLNVVCDAKNPKRFSREELLALCDAPTGNLDLRLDHAECLGKIAKKLKNVKKKRKLQSAVRDTVDCVVEAIEEKQLGARAAHLYNRCARVLTHSAGLSTADRASRMRIERLIDAGLDRVCVDDAKRDDLIGKLCWLGAGVVHGRSRSGLKYAWIGLRRTPAHEKCAECAEIVRADALTRARDWDAFIAGIRNSAIVARHKKWAPFIDLAELELLRSCDFHLLGEQTVIGAVPRDDFDVAKFVGYLASALTCANRDDVWQYRCCVSDIARTVTQLAKAHRPSDRLNGKIPEHVIDAYDCLNEYVASQTALGLDVVLYRADYASPADLPTAGIRAKDPDEDQYSVDQHIEDGDLPTRFLSFSSQLPAAFMYWIKASKVGDERALCAVELAHAFRVWRFVGRDGASRGVPQARATVDREFVVEPADACLPFDTVARVYDVAACVRDNDVVREFVADAHAMLDGNGKKLGYDKFVGKYVEKGVEQHLKLH